MRISAFVLGVALLSISLALAGVQRSHAEDELDRGLTRGLDQELAVVDGYFERARAIILLTAQNPAFEAFYQLPGDRLERIRTGGQVLADAIEGMAFLEALYPDSIGEVCFIDRGGAENARVVRGEVAGIEDLSPDESENPFFAPTFALEQGYVYQAAPYVSPDTGEWVISNSTVVPSSDGRAHAIVHFEVTVESFRRLAEEAAGDEFDLAVVDAATGRVVIDSKKPQRVGGPLGAPRDRRFESLAGEGPSSGSLEADGRRGVFARLERGRGNANDWIVVAVARSPLTVVSGVGFGPPALVLIALGLLGWSLVQFRSSRRHIEASAFQRGQVLDQTVKAAEEERSRLARDLHDGPIQRLTTLDLKLERARLRSARGDVETSEGLLDDVQDGIRQEVHGLRRVMAQLRPPVLDERGLEAALVDLVEGVASESDLQCDVRASIPGRLDRTTETVLYRVAQESLRNVVKHAGARNVQVMLAATNGTTVLEVRDDGVGFDPASDRSSHHLGLIAMRERVELGGGVMRLSSRPGRGTRVRVEVPTNGAGR